MARNTNRIHDWRKLKWPFCVTFLYYALLCLYTGSAEASEAGFLAGVKAEGMDDCLILAATEQRTEKEIAQFAKIACS